MNIILTGDKGLIGTYLKERLNKEGHKIAYTIDKKDGKYVSELNGLGDKFSNKVDMFIHTAAFCKINKAIENPRLVFENSKDIFEVLEFCRINKIPKIIYFSSSRVLQDKKNPYTASKIYGEELCKAYFQCYGIEYLIIRPSTVYGPILDYTKRLIHIFISNALLGKDLEIYGNPNTKTLDFSYIDDFIDGVMLALNNKEWNKEYDISGEEEFNIYELSKLIISKTNSISNIKIYSAEIAQPQQVKLDTTEIKKLGYSPKISLKEGVLKTIEEYIRLFKKDKSVFNF